MPYEACNIYCKLRVACLLRMIEAATPRFPHQDMLAMQNMGERVTELTHNPLAVWVERT